MKTVNLKDTFDNVVTIYDAARPLYPAQLLKDVQEFSGTERYDRALEVGAGTGQAIQSTYPCGKDCKFVRSCHTKKYRITTV